MLGERWRYKAVLDAPNIFLSENNKQKYFLSSRNFYYWPVLNPGCISVRWSTLPHFPLCIMENEAANTEKMLDAASDAPSVVHK